jgi:hypothetical protein
MGKVDGRGRIEQVVHDAAKIDANPLGHGIGLAGKTRCLAISELRSFLAEMACDPLSLRN